MHLWAPDVGAGNRTQAPCKSSMRSSLLSHLSSSYSVSVVSAATPLGQTTVAWLSSGFESLVGKQQRAAHSNERGGLGMKWEKISIERAHVSRRV